MTTMNTFFTILGYIFAAIVGIPVLGVILAVVALYIDDKIHSENND